MREEGKKSNLELPLWKIVRASTAAPFYFLPELIEVDPSSKFLFVDGGMTPYNNPALIAYLTATLPAYKFNWPTGVDKLHLVSIGTGRLPSVLKDTSLLSLNLVADMIDMPSALMDGISKQQDFLCRVLGSCIYGEDIDREVRSLMQQKLAAPSLQRGNERLARADIALCFELSLSVFLFVMILAVGCLFLVAPHVKASSKGPALRSMDHRLAHL